MSEQKDSIMVPHAEESTQESPIVLPENLVEVFGGTIETSLKALLGQHVETARALARTIKAQHALEETMDRAVILMQDPTKSVQDAVRELTGMLDLQDKLRKERTGLEAAYAKQEIEYAHIRTQMERLAKERPDLFVLASEPAAA
ncbi:MAG: hypothetical protein AAB413_05020 [Patescibacteria group bacterium]